MLEDARAASKGQRSTSVSPGFLVPCVWLHSTHANRSLPHVGVSILADSPPVREYFSTNASEATTKFGAACTAAKVPVESILHPLTAPDGSPLVVSIARLGALDASRRLLVLSAVHGVEGFAGAGVQTGLADQTRALLPPDTSIILVHLLNPWGVAWNRREDHENVDVFRNLLYHDHPSTPDPLFDEIDAALDLPHWTDPARNDDTRQALAARYGVDRLIAAVRRGQHHKPRGLSYHGQGRCWSTKVLHDVVDRYLAGARRVAVIDTHTGFGPHGHGLVMSYDPPGSVQHQRVSRWMRGDLYTPGSDADIPAHPRTPYGFIENRIPGAEVTATILEYGTEPPEITRDLFPANAHYHLYGNPRSPEGLEVGVRYRRFLYPETDPWKEAVWTRGLEVVTIVLRGMSDW